MTADTPDIAKRAAEMRARAEAATPNKWRIGMTASDGSVAITVSMPFGDTSISCIVCAIDHREADRVHVPALPVAEVDAEHIIASQPTNVLAILDALARADARADKAEQALARLTVNANTAYDKIKASLDAAQGWADEAKEVERALDGHEVPTDSFAHGPYNLTGRVMRYGEMAADEACRPLNDALAAARETIGRLCEAGKPFIGYAERADRSRLDDDGLRSVRVYEIRDLARALASVREGGADG